MHDTPECFGHLLPDPAKAEINQPLRGKVFSFELRSAGIGIQSREVKTDVDAWHQCRTCAEYQSCYDFGMARLALRVSLSNL